MSEEKDTGLDIRYIAKLSRLHIEEAEIPKLKAEMSGIVSLVEHLPSFENTELPIDAKDRMDLREDEIKPSSPREDMLRNAPQTEAGCFVVPQTVSE